MDWERKILLLPEMETGTVTFPVMSRFSHAAAVSSLLHVSYTCFHACFHLIQCFHFSAMHCITLFGICPLQTFAKMDTPTTGSGGWQTFRCLSNSPVPISLKLFRHQSQPATYSWGSGSQRYQKMLSSLWSATSIQICLLYAAPSPVLICIGHIFGSERSRNRLLCVSVP